MVIQTRDPEVCDWEFYVVILCKMNSYYRDAHLLMHGLSYNSYEEKANEPCLRTGVSEHLDHLKAT